VGEAWPCARCAKSFDWRSLTSWAPAISKIACSNPNELRKSSPRCSIVAKSGSSHHEHIAELKKRAAETDLRLKRLYDAIESGIAEPDDTALKERITSNPMSGTTRARLASRPVTGAV
jgi:hypothetical protein